MHRIICNGSNVKGSKHPMPTSTQATEAVDTQAMMKGLVWANNTLSLEQTLPLPTLAKNEARIRVLLAGICNTDLEIIKGYMGYEGVLGHEFVGVVDECPDAPEWVGKRVCVDINAACDAATNMKECATCGNPHHCPKRTVIGIVNHHGGFAHYLKAPIRNLYEVPEHVNNEQAVFTEPLAAAFEILEQTPIQPETSVIVLGDGKLGLLIAMALRQKSHDVTLLGRHPEKLAVLDGLGIRTALSEGYIPEQRVDVVVEATGSVAGLTLAMQLVRPRGILVLKSTVADTTGLNLAPIVVDEITLLGSRCGPFDVALAALATGKIPVERLIQNRYPLHQGVQAIEHAAQKGTLKILLDVDTASNPA
jgi:threonine dehydrogenase-like Zn-dependent dehydrogenase